MATLQETLEKNIPKWATGGIPSDYIRSFLERGKYFSDEKHKEKLEFHHRKIALGLPTSLTKSQWLDDAVFIYGYFNQSTGIDKLIKLLNNKQYDKALELVSNNTRVSYGIRHMMYILLKEGLNHLGIKTSYPMPPPPPEYTTTSSGGVGGASTGGSTSNASPQGSTQQGTSAQTPPESVENIMQEESKYQEKEKKKKNIIIIVGIVIGLIIVALIAYYFYKNKKQ